MIKIEFTLEELKAINDMLVFASEKISLDDEPLMNIVMEKISKELYILSREQG